MKLKIKYFVILTVLLTFSSVISAEAIVVSGEKSSKNLKERRQESVCANQPDGYIYDSKINKSCYNSRRLVGGQICWKCHDDCTKKLYPYTEKDCLKNGLEKGANYCTTIDGIRRYKNCTCAKGYYSLEELNYNTDVFEYDDIKTTPDEKIKCYHAKDCQNTKKITLTSGLTIKNSYAWKNPCSKLKVVSSLKDQTLEDNFYCAIGVECNKDFNCYKELPEKECGLKGKDTSAANFYQGDDNTCYFYQGCRSDGLCITKGEVSDCLNVKQIVVDLYDVETQKTKKNICRKLIHGKNGCLEGFSLTKKYLCTRFDRTPKTTDGEEIDSISYDKSDFTINNFKQSCRKYVECKYGYEEYKPEARGSLTATDLEEAKEGDAYEVSYIKAISGEKENYIICRKFKGCAANKCDVSCKNYNSWLRYFLPRKKQ